jgi:hypothetical protein
VQDAANVTLDSLELIGGIDGLLIAGASHDAMFSNSVVRNNLIGIHVDPGAARALITQNEIFANSGAGAFQAAVNIEGDDARIEDNVIRNNTFTAINTTLAAQNTVIRGNDIFGNPGFAINANGTNELIEQNSIHANASPGFPAAVSLRTGTIQDNQIFGNSRPGITLIQSGAIVQRNVIHDNTDGITAAGAGNVIRDNRIYHNSQAGVRLTGSGVVVTGNSIYANATGVIAAFGFGGETSTIVNNVIYDSTSAGIELNVTTPAGQGAVNIHNNTFFEPTSTAVRLIAGPATDVRNNILSTATGTLFNVANTAQAGFTSDFNLLHVTGSGKVGIWGSDNLVNRTDWYYELGRDQYSIEADPQLIDIDGPDNRRGFDVATNTDFGVDDNFHEQIGSPAVDAGATLRYYSLEPNSGNRVNIGAFGNTLQATPSSTLGIQLTDPAGLAKFEVGQAIPINWISSGFSASAPVALINAGGLAVSDPANGRWGAEAFRIGGSTGTVTGAIDTSLVPNPPPLAVLSTFVQGPSNQVTSTRYDVPLPDGSYNIRLIFVDPVSVAVNQRKFDVLLQGQTVLPNYDIFAEVGTVRKAVAKSFSFNATQGTGLQLELITRLTNGFGFGSIISGIEVTKANPTPSTLTANLEFSPDNGANWTTIATNLSTNRFGEGSFNWNATTETIGNTGRFRITAVSNGVPSVQHVGQPISVANGGNAYYVNIGTDGNLLDNEYTSATGDNANTGKSPNAPMKSLAALVRAYDLDAGDTVFVDSGTYNLLTNVEFFAADSGARIQGPIVTGHVASLDRANTAVGNWAIVAHDGTSGLTVDSLELRGGEVGFLTGVATNIELRNSVMRNNSYAGVYFHNGSSNIRVLNNQILENGSHGIEVRGSQVLIEDNLIRNSGNGVLVTCCTAGDVTIRDNDIFGHNIGVNLSIVALGTHVIQGNTIHDNATQGINANIGGTAVAQIIDNEVFGQSDTGDVGIFTSAPNNASLLVRDNRVRNNFTGVSFTGSGGVVQHNWIYSNNSVGINVTSNGTPEVRDNQIFSNATGMIVNPISTAIAPQVRNNLVYSNTNVGIDVPSGSPVMVGNTIVHPVGTAVRFTGSGTGTLKNNIVSANVGTLVSVATGGQAAFVSDRNDLFPASAAANVGLWGATPAATLANWRTISGRDLNSISADPLFLDIDGPDNVLGEQGVTTGNGFDDNFGLRANSPAIDAADGSVGLPVDLLGRPRRDDPDRPNTGIGTTPFVDMGAYEFQGNSADVTPPTVTGVQPVGIFAGGNVPSTTNSITLSFSEPMDLLSVQSPGLYQLIGDGLDQQFDTGDDVVIGISGVAYTAGSLDATLSLSQALPTDRYRLTLFGQVGKSHVDQAGNRLDGDANGSAGGDFVRIFNSSTALGPVTDADAAANQVAENSVVGTVVGVTALASDPDAGDTVSYTLDDDAGGRFAIHPVTGVVTVASGSGLNREVAASHDIVVRGTSSDGSSATAMFTIAVTDVDEFDVGPVTDTNAASNEVSENSTNGTLVGITASASDPDATTNAITFSLTNSAGGRFQIDTVTGVVSVANGSLIDREQTASHAITVRATSADGSFSEQAFTINVLDIDEFNVGPITDTNAAPDRVQPGAAVGSAVGITAFASDADATNNAIAYTLQDNSGGRFAIDPVTGVITVANPLNNPPASSYDVVVRATSADGSFSTRTFTIQVGTPGDFDGDGDLDISDVDALSAAIATNSGNLAFDTNGDGVLNLADLQHWVLNLKRTVMGDANLDFVTDGSDFNIWNANKFTVTNQWSRGDFNANGVVDGSDFNIWNANKFTSGPGSSSRPAEGVPTAPALAIDAVFAGRSAARGRKDVADAIFAGENSWR